MLRQPSVMGNFSHKITIPAFNRRVISHRWTQMDTDKRDKSKPS